MVVISEPIRGLPTALTTGSDSVADLSCDPRERHGITSAGIHEPAAMSDEARALVRQAVRRRLSEVGRSPPGATVYRPIFVAEDLLGTETALGRWPAPRAACMNVARAARVNRWRRLDVGARRDCANGEDPGP
jgi:hypothetical protein